MSKKNLQIGIFSALFVIAGILMIGKGHAACACIKTSCFAIDGGFYTCYCLTKSAADDSGQCYQTYQTLSECNKQVSVNKHCK
ncbi:MAG: hypothetical protein ACD_16C00110G0017 [uncultured bacterium]|nr:MAG: hypothetical protein ACD_16C00110G0017 [uncultured bacterium]OFW73226.1 MAG: hypothetical protein A2Z80_07215 [Alphaproteobacteria bacterium GWA2_41_27]OFW92830.1 MAG: hypothetical protein A2W46_02865 [Alphaproteobacteria bacterium RIFCSPHIGHO2_12_42_13]OFX04053.1 MAG: hypothetical protein A3H46_07360 [Alphaproteobacteria bacterium RIFCSPLOWO2_02_FULL_43_54]OFX07497.1 MAG: hypothetical protein A3G78_02270 [Alphaproteobacteria bacterium RIFCSPLOWO2_12_FULL_42_29]HBW25173.1 hypothetical 